MCIAIRRARYDTPRASFNTFFDTPIIAYNVTFTVCNILTFSFIIALLKGIYRFFTRKFFDINNYFNILIPTWMHTRRLNIRFETVHLFVDGFVLSAYPVIPWRTQRKS